MYYKSLNGYYYKEGKDGVKKRISKKEYDHIGGSNRILNNVNEGDILFYNFLGPRWRTNTKKHVGIVMYDAIHIKREHDDSSEIEEYFKKKDTIKHYYKYFKKKWSMSGRRHTTEGYYLSAECINKEGCVPVLRYRSSNKNYDIGAKKLGCYSNNCQVYVIRFKPNNKLDNILPLMVGALVRTWTTCICELPMINNRSKRFEDRKDILFDKKCEYLKYDINHGQMFKLALSWCAYNRESAKNAWEKYIGKHLILPDIEKIKYRGIWPLQKLKNRHGNMKDKQWASKFVIDIWLACLVEYNHIRKLLKEKEIKISDYFPFCSTKCSPAKFYMSLAKNKYWERVGIVNKLNTSNIVLNL